MYSYGKDAYIMSYIFGYKLKLIENNIYVCAFPKNGLNKVMAKLENKKINYIVLDRRNNYRVDERFDNGNLNKYSKYIEKAIKYVKRKKQIDIIYKELIINIDNNLDNFPKKDIELKNRIRNISYDLLELAYEANTTANKERRIELIYKIIAKLKLTDFLINICYDKQIINEKRYLKFGEREYILELF